MEAASCPIAIVGISCRFSGNANNPEELWKMLLDGRNGWSEVPEDRYYWQSFYHPDPAAQLCNNHRGGHFLDQDIAAFDAKFFGGIGTNEADTMDPCQRILLELSYEAIENAGIRLEDFTGTDSAVYIASFNNDYPRLHNRDTYEVAPAALTGAAQTILASRISYVFNLKGPSMVIDTACSGSMVALHAGCQSLKLGETNIALVGATNLIIDPDLLLPLSMQRFLSSQGRSQAFEAEGEGYGRGEGGSILVLKRLDDAIRDGDSIRAVIRNTAVGQDGKTAGITLPSGEAQEELVRSAYSKIGLDPKDTTFVEAHGTGTVAGDYTEVGALAKAFAGKDATLFVGSIKANVGHTESVSGLAGVIKAVLAIEHGIIPPNPIIKAFRPGLIPEGSTIVIPQEACTWPKDVPRRASVNSFGYGGTNGHCILESLQSYLETRKDASDRLSGTDHTLLSCTTTASPNDSSPKSDANLSSKSSTSTYTIEISDFSLDNKHGAEIEGDLDNNLVRIQDISSNDDQNLSLESKSTEHSSTISIEPQLNSSYAWCTSPQSKFVLPVSAKSVKSLERCCESIGLWLESCDSPSSIANLAYTLIQRRSQLTHRCSCIVSVEPDGKASVLPRKGRPSTQSSTALKTFFVFTGQGAQWATMGRELLQTSSVFHHSILLLAQILVDMGAEWNLLEELSRDAQHTNLDKSYIGQPASTAIQLALVDTLYDLGVRPYAVIGHSSGEIGAAYAAGVISREDAMRIAYHRGALSDRSFAITGHIGSMLAVGLGADDAQKWIQTCGAQRLVVACENSPLSSTISGDAVEIDTLLQTLQSKSIFARKLKVDTAYHSYHMDLVGKEYLAALGHIQELAGDPEIKFYSTVDGRPKSTGFGGAYWVENLVSKVRFRQAIESLCEDYSITNKTPNCFVEIGAHHALAGPLRETITQLITTVDNISFLPSLVRHQHALTTILQTLGHLYENGSQVDLQRANSLSNDIVYPKVVQDLAPYPWDHEHKFWSEPRLSKEYRFRRYPPHDLLGIRVIGTSPTTPIWRHRFSLDTLPWLAEHVVDGHPVFPASGFIAMALEAKRQISIDRKISEKILNYIIKDFAVVRPLPIPESPAMVELQIALKPIKRVKNKDQIAWESFLISSVSSDGSWHEHVSGQISVELQLGSNAFTPSTMSEGEVRTLEEKSRLNPIENGKYQSMDSSELYNELQSRGNRYGPLFATLQNYKMDASHAISSFVVPDVADTMPMKYLQKHIIHPAPLDTIIHSCVPLFVQQVNTGSIVTHTIEEIIVSAQALCAIGTHVQVATELAMTSHTSAVANISAFVTTESGDTQLAIRMRDGGLRAISDEGNSTENLEQTFTLEWHRDPTLTPPGQYVFNEFESLPSEDESLLWNQLASVYLQDCFKTINPSEVVPEQQNFFDWTGQFVNSPLCNSHVKDLSPEQRENLTDSSNHTSMTSRLTALIGTNLQAILTGKVSALEIAKEAGLLLHDGIDESSRRCNAWILQFMKDLAFKKSTLRILQVGAGTDTTLSILEALTQLWNVDIERYDLTDISSNSLEQAKPKLAAFSSFVHYNMLDINQDPTLQEFSTSSYDIVLAFNSLHLVENLDDGLKNIRSMLKPDGHLILMETTNFSPYIGLCSGILEGFFSRKTDGREDSPLLSKEQWRERLLRSSFDGLTYLADDYIESSAQKNSVMISKALDEPPTSAENKQIVLLQSPYWSEEHKSSVERLIIILQNEHLDVAIKDFSTFEYSESTIYMVVDDGYAPLLTSNEEDDFRALTRLLCQPHAQILWVMLPNRKATSLDQEQNLILGVLRTARLENSTLKAISLDMTRDLNSTIEQYTAGIHHVLELSFLLPQNQQSLEQEICIRDGSYCIPRLRPDTAASLNIEQAMGFRSTALDNFHQSDRPLMLHVGTRGLLDSLYFADDILALSDLDPDQVEVSVTACSVNFKDVMVSMGQLSENVSMAGECAGTVTAVGKNFKHKFQVGDRVFGSAGQPYTSRARLHGHCAAKVPENLSISEGASLSVVFFTAYHALVDLANLSQCQTVLIHAAAGGVGQAAVQIAKHVGAEVFVTVGSDSKMQFMMDHFGIPKDHIFSSRNGYFKPGILRQTKGAGIDVVLNSLSGDLLQDSLDCLAEFGAFVEIGKFDIQAKHSINLQSFDRNLRFFSIDATLIGARRPEVISRTMSKVLPLIESGSLRPIEPLTFMPLTNIEDAFRLLQTGKQTGKIILESNPTTLVKVSAKPQAPPVFSEPGTYLIAGGLGGIGIKIARMLARRGAQYIALLGRRNVTEEYQVNLSSEFRAMGAHVILIQVDIASDNCQKILQNALQKLPPVKGFFQCAMTMQNELLDAMSLESFHYCTKPKVNGTKNVLNALSQSPLEFCIMLSSLTGLFGSRGGANYGAGNVFLDAIAEASPRSSCRYTSMALGPIKGFGVLARNPELQEYIGKAQGFVSWGRTEIFALLDYIFNSHLTPNTPKLIACGFTKESLAQTKQKSALSSPVLTHVLRDTNSDRENVDSADNNGSDATTMTKIRASIMAADDLQEIHDVFLLHVNKKLSYWTFMDAEAIPQDSSVTDLGLDSLVVVEFKNWISRTFKAALQSSDITDARNLDELVWKIVQKSTLVEDHPNSGKVKKPSEAVAAVKIVPKETSDSANTDTDHSLPRQPLPKLDHIIDGYLKTIAANCSPDELAMSKTKVQAFAASIGSELHKRAAILHDTHKSADWLSEKYLANYFLKRRGPLYDSSSFCSSLLLHPGQHSMARVAAAYTAVAIDLMRSIQDHKLDVLTLVGKTVGSKQLEQLFGAIREPHHTQDEIRVYEKPCSCIVLFRGSIYKIDLFNQGSPVECSELESIFSNLIKTPTVAGSFLSTLTADNRDSWATNRKQLEQRSSNNAANLQCIESAAFILCLDDFCPQNADQRSKHVLFGDAGRNRWYDKLLQIVICGDGTAHIVIEHSTLDGAALSSLQDQFAPKVEIELGKLEAASTTPIVTEDISALEFDLEPQMISQISNVSQQVSHFASQYSFDNWTIHLGRQFWAQHSILPKPGLQVLWQLANRLHFGHYLSSLDCVSLASFEGGRVSLVQTLTTETIEFCDYVIENMDRIEDANIQATNAKLLNAATVGLHESVAQAGDGKAPVHCLKYLSWFLEPGEERPSLFDDPVFLRQEGGMLFVSDSLEHNAEQCGSTLPYDGSVWLHFQASDTEVKLASWTRKPTNVESWKISLAKAVDLMERLLPSREDPNHINKS